MNDRTHSTRGEPIRRAQRIDALDVLRGFALGGIVLFNIQVLSGLTFLSPERVETLGATVADEIATLLVHVLVDEKFYSLFSLLFGIGFSILMGRSAEKGAAFAPFFRRRLAVLIGFGLAHALLIWFGDILVLYAVLGFVLLAFRDRAQRTILWWAAGLYASPVVVYILFLAAGMPDPFASLTTPSAEPSMLDQMLAALREGGYVDVVLANAFFYVGAWIRYLVFLRIPKVLGMFLLGVWIDRKGVLRALEGHAVLLARTARWGLGVGLPLNVAAAILIERHVYLPASPWGLLQTAIAAAGVPALALGYAASIALLMRGGTSRARLMALAPMGRMALTNYLLQSVAGVAVFYGIGLGLFGEVRPLAAYGIALAIFALQVLVSGWWMARFAFGPAEWLWRRLTYRRPLAIRRPVETPATPAGGA